MPDHSPQQGAKPPDRPIQRLLFASDPEPPTVPFQGNPAVMPCGCICGSHYDDWALSQSAAVNAPDPAKVTALRHCG